MALYGANLAKAVRDGTTWDQATDLLGSLETGVRACYSSLDLWNDWKAHGTVDAANLAILSVISSDDAARAKALLDEELSGLFAFDSVIQEHLSEGDGALPEDYLAILRSKTETASDLIHLVDGLFHTSVGTQVSDAIVPVVGGISDTVANALSKVLGNLIAGLWPYLLGAGIVIWYLRRGVR